MGGVESETFEIEVTPRLQQLFASAVINGKGGYQSLCRMLRERLTEGATLHLNAREFQRVINYSIEYGSGGFQAHFRELVALWAYQHKSSILGGEQGGANGQ